MRALLPVLLVAVSACTPEIVSGAYLCGTDSSCPDDLVCNGPDNLCVLPSQVQPFACDPSFVAQQDLATVDCVSVPFEKNGCMVAGDSRNWVTFDTPTVCAAAIAVQARLAFPAAFAELSLELWDLDANSQIATDIECTAGADTGEMRRCLDHELSPGTKYRVEVTPTGAGTCDGACDYNRYTLRVQFATPG